MPCVRILTMLNMWVYRFGFKAGHPFHTVSSAICNSSCGDWPIGGTTSISMLKDLCDT